MYNSERCTIGEMATVRGENEQCFERLMVNTADTSLMVLFSGCTVRAEVGSEF